MSRSPFQDAQEFLCGAASLFEDAGKRADLELAVERNDAPRRAAAPDHVTALLPDTGGPQIFQPANSLITGHPGAARRHGWTPRTSSGKACRRRLQETPRAKDPWLPEGCSATHRLCSHIWYESRLV